MRNKNFGEKLFDFFNIWFMLLLCVFMLYPFLNQMAISFNDGMDSAKGGVTLFPRAFTWDNYRIIFASSDISNSFFLTVSIVVISVICNIIVSFACAYGLNKKDLPYRNVIVWIFLVPQYIGAGAIPIYMLYAKIGLLNNYLVYILPTLWSFYYVMVIRAFLRGIPESLEEAALIDGASQIQILFKIFMPLSLPVLATISLWVAVGKWSTWTQSMIYITDKHLYTLQYIMMRIIKESETVQSIITEMGDGDGGFRARATAESVRAAALMFTTLPMVILYPFLQKYFVKGVVIGSVKD